MLANIRFACVACLRECRRGRSLSQVPPSIASYCIQENLYGKVVDWMKQAFCTHFGARRSQCEAGRGQVKTYTPFCYKKQCAYTITRPSPRTLNGSWRSDAG